MIKKWIAPIIYLKYDKNKIIIDSLITNNVDNGKMGLLEIVKALTSFAKKKQNKYYNGWSLC